MITKSNSRLFALVAILLLFLGFFHNRSRLDPQLGLGKYLPGHGPKGLPSLPPDYAHFADSVQADEWCDERFGTEYIRAFGRSPSPFCGQPTNPTLTCYSHKSHDTRTDAFCFGRDLAFHGPEDVPFSLNCPTLELAENHGVLADLYDDYFWETGPRAILENYIDLQSEGQQQVRSLGERNAEDPETLILVKREGEIGNLWHTLMQTMSASLTLDALRVMVDPMTGKNMYTEKDHHKAQVVILDDLEDGPLYTLWGSFTDLPVVRVTDLNSTMAPANMILPLAGSSNPFWQGDWEVLPCDDSALVKTFSRRILSHYGVLNQPRRSIPDGRRTLTFIDRKNRRHLIGQNELIASLEEKFPEVRVQVVDFAAYTFVEQLGIVRDTDILLGVHGAGLTHAMFMRPGSTIVEIMPPDFYHMGFHALCKFVGLNYFTEHAEEFEYEGKHGHFQNDDVFMSPEVFLPLMEKAIRETS